MDLPMDAALSQEDVSRLLASPSPSARLDIARKLSSHYTEAELSPKERAIADDIFLVLLRSAELEVREALAHNLKDSEALSQEVLHALVDNEDSVSVPVLRSSVLLSDDELVEIVRTTRKAARHLAVAARDHVSAPVSDALVDSGNPSVVEVLLVNENAEIRKGTYERILEGFNQHEHVLRAMVNRGGLPLDIAERLVSFVSGSLEEKLRRKYHIPTQSLHQAARASREITTVNLLDSHVSPEDVEKLVDQLIVYNRLSPSLVFMALCRGHRRFFDLAVAKLAAVSPKNAQILMDDKGALGFKALYRKTSFPESMNDVVKLVRMAVIALEKDGKVEPGTLHYSRLLADKVSELSQGQSIDNLTYMMAIIQQQGAEQSAMAV